MAICSLNPPGNLAIVSITTMLFLKRTTKSARGSGFRNRA